MANAFYRPGETRAARVNDLFGAIAHRYDLANDLQSLGLHRRWKERVAQRAGVGVGQVVLDVCCGTGDVSFALARTGARVLGLDFSGPMLEVARGRGRRSAPQATAGAAPPHGQQPMLFLRGDALHLPFRNGSVDAVTISYGLRNLANVPAGVVELWRVLRPGGRLVVLDFGKPRNAAWRQCYFAYLRWFVPVLGRVICGSSEAYAYILESLIHYPAQSGVEVLIRGLRPQRCELENLMGGVMSIHCAVK